MMDESELLNERALALQYEEALFRIAMLRLENRRAEEMTREEAAEGACLVGLSEQSLNRILKSIHRESRRRRTSDFIHITAPKVVRIAAMLLLICFLGLTTALAASKTVRIYLAKFLMTITDTHTELSLELDKTTYVDVPADWKGLYYPSYIPEGYELVQVSYQGRICEAMYYGSKNRELVFGEFASGVIMNIDTEDGMAYETVINGNVALVSEKNNATYITWSYGNVYFILQVSENRETATKVAESVLKIF